ncbi:MAG: hypothetical protein Q8K37_06990 [Alphaproteobacteria bacterium]|nr:hypothetical protein [Alphaproteobacteria bacterium]MDP3533667.1 hypothetical protein [Alphaproteobacteria bacterium]
MKKMLHGRILDYTSIIFMTVVFISLYYFRMSSHLYGFLLFLSFFPYFFKLFLTQKVQEDMPIFLEEKKMPLMSFLLTNFIIFSSFIIVISYGSVFFQNSFGWLLLILFFYLTSKEYSSSFMIYFILVIMFSMVSCFNKEHSVIEIISYVAYMYAILSKFKIKMSDKCLSKIQR